MNTRLTLALTAVATTLASPALAAKGPFFSLANTDFVVMISFVIFIGVIVYFKVPAMITGMLDKRSEEISSEIDEARKLQEDAKKLLADFERQQKDVQDQASRIVAQAKEDAEAAAEAAKKDLETSIARRLAAAEDQIASAEASAVKDVRDQAVIVAIAAAREVIAKQMTAADAGKLIDDAITQVDAKLH